MKTITEIKELVAIKKVCDKAFGFNIAKNTREQAYINARIIYYKLCKDFTHHSSGKIGGIINRDHTTVLHSLKNFEYYILKDKYYNKLYTDLYNVLEPNFNNDHLSIDETIENYSTLEMLNAKKEEIKELREQIKSMVNLQSNQEVKLLNLFRSLDKQGQKDAIFKIETAKKIKERIGYMSPFKI